MIRRILGLVEPFILLLLATVALASLVPARGGWAVGVSVAADAGIVLLFFLHGARLSRQAILDGLRNWRLHLAVLGVSFVAFPLLGLGAAALPFVAPPVAAGLLFLTLLPSTMQSSIAFTSIARGNVAAAVCAASFSNLLGIVLTPALAALLLHGNGGISRAGIESIVLQLLAPFLLGHLLRPLIGAFVVRQKRLLTFVDRGSILLVVYAAFGAAVVEGLWQRLSLADLGIVAGLCAAILGAIMTASLGLGRLIGLPRDDRIVLLFCGSKKSLAAGVPMAGVLFAPAQVGMMLLPLMLFHQIQLIACAVIAKRYAVDGDAPLEATSS